MIGFKRDRRRVLERIADGVADHGCRVQRRALFLEVDFDDFLGVVPCSAGVRHVIAWNRPNTAIDIR